MVTAAIRTAVATLALNAHVPDAMSLVRCAEPRLMLALQQRRNQWLLAKVTRSNVREMQSKTSGICGQNMSASGLGHRHG